jgi:hypothetical protein
MPTDVTSRLLVAVAVAGQVMAVLSRKPVAVAVAVAVPK